MPESSFWRIFPGERTKMIDFLGGDGCGRVVGGLCKVWGLVSGLLSKLAVDKYMKYMHK